MFPMIIGQQATRFTAHPADTMFSNIVGRSFRGDYSFIATLRAMLHTRIPKDSHFSIELKENVSFRPAETYGSCAEFLTNVIGHIPTDEIAIINIRQRDERAEATMELFDKLVHVEGGFEQKRDLGLILEQAGIVKYCHIYVNTASKGCVVVVNTLSLPIWHALQCLIPRLVPAYFTDAKPTEIERELLFSLNTGTDEAYIQVLNRMAEGIDFRGFLIKNVVSGVMARAADSHISSVKENIARITQKMQDLMHEYRMATGQLDNQNAMLAGYISRKNAGSQDDELVEFLSMQDWFTPVDRFDNGFSFIIRSFIDMFDPDMYETLANNRHSFIWDADYSGDFSDRDDRRLLLDAIFGNDATMKIHTCAYFSMNVSGSIDTSTCYGFPAEFDDCIPNVHLDQYHCFGDHAPLINERIGSGDLIGAIMQCKLSASSQNVGETPTMTRLLSDLFKTSKKCIRLEDGRDVTPVEALNILKEGSDA